MTDELPPSEVPQRLPPAFRSSRHAGPTCKLSSIVLLVLALVLYVFGLLYFVDPNLSVSSIQGIAVSIGLHLPAAPSTSSGAFYGWIGFTFAYMMAAGTCAFLASRGPEGRTAYLNVLLVLKGTSATTGAVLFLAQAHYAFYLATVLTDGLLFVLVWFVRAHLVREHSAPRLLAKG